MHDDRERVDPIAVHEHVDLCETLGREPAQVVAHGRVAPRRALEPIVEVDSHLRQRQLVAHDGPVVAVHHELALHPATLLAQGQHGAEVLGRRVDLRQDAGLENLANLAGRGEVAGSVNLDLGTVALHDPIDDRGRCDDQVKSVLALQPLLGDLHVQQTEVAATEAKAERLAGLRLGGERGVVELQLRDRPA